MPKARISIQSKKSVKFSTITLLLPELSKFQFIRLLLRLSLGNLHLIVFWLVYLLNLKNMGRLILHKFVKI